jgi:zinc protease
MNTALGGLFSSRINMNLREEHGYTYGAFSTVQFRRGIGPFLPLLVFAPTSRPPPREILTELKRIRESELTADELTKAKTPFQKRWLRILRPWKPLIDHQLGRYIRLAPRLLPRSAGEITKVNSADTLRVAEYLHPDAMIVVTVRSCRH